MDNEVLRNIKERRSIRRFKQEQIKDEELNTVLEAGTWAPTGMGSQTPFIVALQNEKQKTVLTKINAEIMGTTSDPYYNAPTHIYVFAPKDNANNVKDGSLILGTMMLAAHSIGLGSCWINRVDKMVAYPEMQQLMKEWGLPDGLMGVGSLAIGYPDGAPHAAKPRKKDYYRIIK